jgi:hypothetical protein
MIVVQVAFCSHPEGDRMPYSAKHYVIGAMAVTMLAGLSTTAAQAAPDQTTCTWTVRTLPAAPGFTQSFSYGTDHGSHVFGAATNDSGITENPAVWSIDGSTPPRLLGSAHGAPTRIMGLNTAGVAAGYYRDSTGTHAVRHADGGYQDLPVPAGTNQAEAVDINARGDIVGTIDNSTIILWPADRPGTYTLLPKVAGDSAEAKGIDDARNVVGLIVHDDQLTGYIWNAAGKATPLPAAEAGAWVNPEGIRNGRVVGNENGPQRDTVVVFDLSGRPIWRLAEHVGESINAAGLVLGFHGVPDGAIQQLLRNGAVVAPLPSEQGFGATGWPSALTDGGWLAGDIQSHVTVARCS